jgi:hypothetical protein
VSLDHTAADRPLGIGRALALLFLAIVVGTAAGFVVRTVFGGWKLVELRLGWFLFALGVCFCFRFALKPLGLAPLLDLTKVTRSTIPVWKHPAIWSFALGVAFVQFRPMLQLNWNAVRHAVGWAAIDFLGMYATMVVIYWGLSPAKWERDA